MYQSIAECAIFTRQRSQIGTSSRSKDIRENKIDLVDHPGELLSRTVSSIFQFYFPNINTSLAFKLRPDQ